MERKIDRRIGAASAAMRALYQTVEVKMELSRKESGEWMVLPAHGHSTMNGSSTVSSASQASRVKTEPDEWSKEDCLTLLEKIRTILPDSDSMKYKTTESHFDWEKVCFGGFTGDMCKQKWQKVSTEVRKYRTMTELIVDALEYVKNPYKGKKLKTHPEFPKKPLTPYFRFFMEKRAKYAKIHPEMSNLDLTKILSKKYKELPEKKKQKYITEFQSEKESFEKNMARFRENHPELIEERKKSDLPEKPKTPQQLWYNHEKKTYMKLHPDVSQKELKEALRRQWSQLSDKKRLKWISKALELQKDYEGDIRVYHNAHPDINTEDHVKSVLTKAERQLKDKFDGRPTKPPPNGYSLYCAELMVNMKDVPSTERMVLCSKQWKMMTQKEKDMFQKRCEQKKKQYDVDLQRFLESLPEEERERVLMEEKLGGSRAANASPHRTKSPSSKERCGEAEAELWAPTTATTKDREHSRKSTLPQSPKSAEKMWQQSVLGDYLLKFRTTEKAIVDAARLCKFKWSTISTRTSFSSGSLMSGRGQSQSDSRKAQSSMEAAWKAMEKKEKISWIKRAAEDQKRYEVQYGSVRELLETRLSLIGNKKNKFTGEPKKPPVSGYQMFSQELLTNGELNHFSLKERMVEIGKRWHKLSQAQKDQYKKLVEEQQTEYKARLEVWVKSLSPQDRAVYREFSTTKRRSTTKPCAPVAKVRVTVRKKVVGVRATATVTGSGKRSMAYRAKQDSSESDDVRTASDSSDSEDEEGSSDSSDSYEDGENDNGGGDDDDDDEDAQSADSSSSSEDCSDSDSD